MSYDSVENVQKILGIKPMPIIDILSQNDTVPSKPALGTLGKSKLEQMLSLLDYSKFAEIDSKCRQDNYLWGKQPLLKYTKEALAEYARLIYYSILPHFDTMTLTEEEYVAKWTAPYTDLQIQLASKAAGFISTLTAIATNPIISSNRKIIAEPDHDLYAQITAFLSGDNDFYEDLNDFLFNSLSPLRKDDVTDTRVIALLAEVDALRAKYNKKLEAYAFKYSDYIEKTEEIHNPSENKKKEIVYLEKDITKLSYKFPTDKVLYGREMRRCRKLVQYCKSFHSLRPKTVSMLTAHKDKISSADWDIITQAMESKVLTSATRKVIAANLKLIKNAIAQASASVIVDPIDTIALNETFISGFIAQLGNTYAMPVIKDPKEPPTAKEQLDDAYTALDTLYNAHTQGVNSETVQAQQEANKVWYSYYDNISQALMACLQITLNKLSPDLVLSEEVLEHGGIQGLLAFAKQVRNPDISAYDYENQVQELRHQIQLHTDYYTEVALLPKIDPMTKEQLIDSISKDTAAVLILPSLFDLTPPIHKVMDRIHASVVTTGSMELLPAKDVDIQSLTLVPDVTVKEMATMLTGQPTTPYLLDANGDLIFHIDGSSQYVKPVPTIADGNYKDKTYHFRAYSWNTLTGHIHDLQQLLKRTPEFIEWQNPSKERKEQEQEQDGIKPLPRNFTYKLLPQTAVLRKEACDEANALFDFLFAMAEDAFVNNEEIQDYLEQLNQIHSFKDLYINGKRLAAWVYYPEEYRLISDPPVDATTGKELDYEPDHLDGDPSNNSKKNLEIKLKQANLDARSTSRPVTYNGHKYPTTTKYCNAFSLGYDYLNKELKKLKLGDIFDSNGRIYSLNSDSRSYTAIDTQTKAPVITYNGIDYETPKAFAKSLKLNYVSLSNALGKARKAGHSEFTCKLSHKKYTFYLDNLGNITKII